MNLQGSLHACLMSVSFQIRTLLVIVILLPSLALAGLKVSHADIQALIDKGYFMTAYQQCVDKGYSDDKAKILEFFHQQVDTLEKGIPEGAKVTKIVGSSFPSEKIVMPDGIAVFRKDLAFLDGEEQDPALPFIDELNFKISDYLKVNLVPPTEARSSRVYQLFVSEALTGAELGFPDRALTSSKYPQLGKLAVWDVFTGQQDRSTSLNWMVSESGELIAIDNSESLKFDMAFYSAGEGVTIKPHDLTPRQLQQFFTNPETLEILKKNDALGDEFNAWTEGMDISPNAYFRFRYNLLKNAKSLVSAADSHNITSDLPPKAEMLMGVDRLSLKGEYKLAQKLRTAQGPCL